MDELLLWELVRAAETPQLSAEHCAGEAQQ
jgi:hypothetical protein